MCFWMTIVSISRSDAFSLGTSISTRGSIMGEFTSGLAR